MAGRVIFGSKGGGGRQAGIFSFSGMRVLKELISFGWNLMGIRGIAFLKVFTLFISGGRSLDGGLARWSFVAGMAN